MNALFTYINPAPNDPEKNKYSKLKISYVGARPNMPEPALSYWGFEQERKKDHRRRTTVGFGSVRLVLGTNQL